MGNGLKEKACPVAHLCGIRNGAIRVKKVVGKEGCNKSLVMHGSHQKNGQMSLQCEMERCCRTTHVKENCAAEVAPEMCVAAESLVLVGKV